MSDSVAEIAPVELTERQGRIANGVALMQAGSSVREAAATVGIPATTLHDAYQRLLGPDAANREEQRQKTDERMLATAYCVAEQVLTRMAAEAGHAEHRTLTAWGEVSTRIIGRLRRWDRGLGETSIGETVGTVLDRLSSHGGARLTLTVEPLERSHTEAYVDVTPGES